MFLIILPSAVLAETAPTSVAPVATPVAQSSCRTEVSYKWNRASKDGKDEERVVFFSIIEQRGETIEIAKTRLAETVAREKGRAYERCRQEHQNMSGCVATRFGSNASVAINLGFAARKALEQAIDSDCSAVQGVCGAVSASEPECREPPKPVEEAVAAPAEAKKGDAKKKK